MSFRQEVPGTDTSGPLCPMCGQAAHVTKASVLACSSNRRKEFAELAALVRPKPKESA